MNKQRKVLITITYNEMGIIIDTKAEEVAQLNLQQTCNNLATDSISIEKLITFYERRAKELKGVYGDLGGACSGVAKSIKLLTAQPEVTEEAVKEYCRKRCLTILTNDYFHKLSSAQPDWIPCSERLPEKKGLYLSTTLNRDVFCDYWNGINFDRTELVIAWMPLPEPYEGRQK